TAFAAGHRPCALCRREDYDRFGEIWRSLHPGEVGADAIDTRLHGERVEPQTRGHRLHEADLADLPDGAFVLRAGIPLLVLGSELLRWSTAGYVDRLDRTARRGTTIITPPSLVEVLRAGWHPVVPLFHPSAGPDCLEPARRRVLGVVSLAH